MQLDLRDFSIVDSVKPAYKTEFAQCLSEEGATQEQCLKTVAVQNVSYQILAVAHAMLFFLNRVNQK